MTYKYLYQDKQNRNCEGDIKARDRAEAYMLLRKQGIRPYRVIGDDPWRWQPWAIGAGYAILMSIIVVMAILLMAKFTDNGAKASTIASEKSFYMSEEEARLFREKAEDAVYRAPEAYRYNVWKGVNARLIERGLEPIECPEGLAEE